MRKIVLLLALLGLLGSAAGAVTYEIHMSSGKVFLTRYRPFLADFDSSQLMFLTDQSNWTTVSVSEVAEVTTLEESLGFGTVIDDVTLMIGFTANDNLSPEEEAALEAEFAAAQAEGRFPDFTSPTFSEPNSGGGIPLGFLNTNTPPMGESRGGGSLSNARRGGGGVIAEPFVSDN